MSSGMFSDLLDQMVNEIKKRITEERKKNNKENEEAQKIFEMLEQVFTHGKIDTVFIVGQYEGGDGFSCMVGMGIDILKVLSNYAAEEKDVYRILKGAVSIVGSNREEDSNGTQM